MNLGARTRIRVGKVEEMDSNNDGYWDRKSGAKRGGYSLA